MDSLKNLTVLCIGTYGENIISALSDTISFHDCYDMSLIKTKIIHENNYEKELEENIFNDSFCLVLFDNSSDQDRNVATNVAQEIKKQGAYIAAILETTKSKNDNLVESIEDIQQYFDNIVFISKDFWFAEIANHERYSLQAAEAILFFYSFAIQNAFIAIDINDIKTVLEDESKYIYLASGTGETFEDIMTMLNNALSESHFSFQINGCISKLDIKTSTEFPDVEVMEELGVHMHPKLISYVLGCETYPKLYITASYHCNLK